MSIDPTQASRMEKTWKPKAAGILDIIVGSQCLIVGLGLLLIGIACDSIARNLGDHSSSILLFMSAIALPLFICGILAIRGGLYALKRERWRFALAGSIAAFLPLCIPWLANIVAFTAHWDSLDAFLLLGLLLGIAAIVLTILSKNEFE